MRLFYICLAVLFSSNTFADGPCVNLAKVVGTFKQVSRTCDHSWLGSELSVVPFDESNSWPDLVGKGYWITSGGVGFGPTTQSNDLDKCTLSGDNLHVEINGNDTSGNALPGKGWVEYVFSGTQVTFRAGQCTAVYTK